MQLRVFLQLIRFPDWTKNFFVLLPAFFGGQLAMLWHDPKLICAFFAFCFTSGAVYIINDSCDAEADRLHPEKKKRPLAARLVSAKTAGIIATVFLLAGFTLGFFSGAVSCYMLLYYLCINLSYSLFLKKIPVVDILLVASGFLLRIMAGGAASGVEISSWLYAMVFLIAIGIALGKRYDDLLLISSGISANIRPAAAGYRVQFVRILIAIVFSVLLAGYVLYTLSPEIRQRLHSDFVFITALPAFAGVSRYLYLALVLKKSGSPVQLLFRDRWLQFSLLCWFGLFAFFLYVRP